MIHKTYFSLLITFYEQEPLLLVLAFFLLYFERLSLLSFLLHCELFYCQQQQKLNEQQSYKLLSVYDMFKSHEFIQKKKLCLDIYKFTLFPKVKTKNVDIILGQCHFLY